MTDEEQKQLEEELRKISPRAKREAEKQAAILEKAFSSGVSTVVFRKKKNPLAAFSGSNRNVRGDKKDPAERLVEKLRVMIKWKKEKNEVLQKIEAMQPEGCSLCLDACNAAELEAKLLELEQIAKGRGNN